MRDFIMMTEDFLRVFEETVPVVEAPPVRHQVLMEQELDDIIFRLRAYMDNGDGDLATGVEIGMQRAADMIEHLLNWHRES